MTKEAYHIRRADREIKDEKIVEEILGAVKYLTISLCEGDIPYIVALSCGYDGDTRSFYFHCAKKGHKLDILKKNPSVCALAVDDRGYEKGECSHKYRSLVIRGRMSLAADKREMSHGVKVLLRQLESGGGGTYEKFIKSEADFKNVAILRLEIESITAKGNV